MSVTRRITPAVLAALLCPAGAAAATAATRPHATPSADSVVSLLAPAHGSAFAFQHAGELVSTRRAVGTATSVEVVTRTGAYALAPVVATNDPQIVVLYVNLPLRPLHGGRAARDAHLAAQPGPLNAPARRHGRLLDSRKGTTSINGGRAYEGAPVIDLRGAVIGVATQDAHHLHALSLSRLRAPAAPTAPASGATGQSSTHTAAAAPSKSSGGSALPGWAYALLGAVAALVLGAAVTLADSARRRRARRARRARTREREPAAADTQSPGPDTLEVALRPRTTYEPEPSVTLRSDGEPLPGDDPDDQL